MKRQSHKQDTPNTSHPMTGSFIFRAAGWCVQALGTLSDRIRTGVIQKIPVFFLVRIAGWYALSLAILIVSIAWELSFGFSARSLVLPIILSLLLAWKGTDLLYIAVKELYFTKVFVCKKTGFSRFSTQVRNYIDPTSQTPFRISQQASFQSEEDGMQVTFTFDRSRKLHEGARYLFYFRNPIDAKGELTADMLEQLKIDHAILPSTAKGKQEISAAS